MSGPRVKWRPGGRRAVVAVVALAGLAAACDPQLADPHTLSGISSSHDVTFGTGGCYLAPRVPFIRHPALGGNQSTLVDGGAVGDAMRNGPGPWFSGGCNPIWAPSVVFHGGQYIMHYTAGKGGQRCIGRAIANNPQGQYTPVSEWACPPGGRWAIDPSAYRTPGGELYVTYRDDYAVPGQDVCKTAISIVRTNASGEAIWSTRRTALLSDDVHWNISAPNCRQIIENPSLIRAYGNHYYLFFSTGDWQSSRYATGIADCGTNPVGPGRCQLIGSTTRPYWAYSGSGLNPLYTLPGDASGPGGMHVYDSIIYLAGPPYAVGERRAVWHYWAGGDTRYVRNWKLQETIYGFFIG